MRGPAVLHPFGGGPDDDGNVRVRRVRELTGVFPGQRFRDMGATEEEVAESRAFWDLLTAEDQALAAAALDLLTDDELREAIAADRYSEDGGLLDTELTEEERLALAQLAAWAEGATAAGLFLDYDQALNAVDDLEDELRTAALRGEPVDLDALGELHQAALVGVPDAPPELTECILCAELSEEVRATLPEHVPAAHVGNRVLAAPLEEVLDEPAAAAAAAGLEFGSDEWWAAVLPEGAEVLAVHDQPATEGAEATAGSGTSGAEGDASADGAGAEPAPDAAGYPEDGGTIASVLGWVGEAGADGKARAQFALDRELERDEKDQRAGILGPLRKIAGD